MEQQEPQDRSFTATQYNPDQSLNKERLDSSKVIEDLEHRFKGQYWSDERDSWIDGGEDNRLIDTDAGVNDIISTLQMFVRKGVYLSEVKEEKINQIMRHIGSQLRWNKLVPKAEEYFDNDVDKIATVKNAVMWAAYFSISRAIGRGEGKLIGQSSTHVEHHETGNKGVLPQMFSKN